MSIPRPCKELVYSDPHSTSYSGERLRRLNKAGMLEYGPTSSNVSACSGRWLVQKVAKEGFQESRQYVTI